MLDMSAIVGNDSLDCEENKTPERNEDYKNIVCNSEWFALTKDTAVEEEYAEFDKSICKFFQDKINAIDL